jgi:peptidoglycan/xylan/chitin deacetylase (PgdA/CDA1 family)
MASGVTRALKARRLQRRDHRLFILEYHDISPNSSEFEGVISQTRFRRHLEWLNKRFQISTLREATERLTSDERLEGDLMTLTFDDGYQGNFTGAWPILESKGIPATIFLTTGFLDGQELWFDLARRCLAAAQASPSSLSDQARETLVRIYGRWPKKRAPESLLQPLKYLHPRDRSSLIETLEKECLRLAPKAKALTWEQVRTMQDGGAEFGGHTVTHPILSLLPGAEQEKEILLSRRRIQEKTGVLPTSFAYPNGSIRDYTNETAKIVRQAGYQAACTTRKGSNRPDCDPLALRRIGIGSDPTWVIEARLSGLFDEQVRSLVPSV